MERYRALNNVTTDFSMDEDARMTAQAWSLDIFAEEVTAQVLQSVQQLVRN